MPTFLWVRTLILDSQAEPGIRILDPAGAEIRLGRLEALQKKEIEQKFLPQGPTPVDLEARESPRVAGSRAIHRTQLIAATAALIMLGALIATVTQYRGRPAETQHTTEAKPVAVPLFGGKEAPAGGLARTYRIEGGDTLGGLAKKLYQNPDLWRDIARANPGLDPRRLRPGQIINLPRPASRR
jgi:nucleoid-associated protein YgaU